MLVYWIKFSLDSCRKWNIWFDFQKLHFHKLVFKCFPVIHNCANNLGKIKKKFLWKTYVNITKIIYHLTHFFSLKYLKHIGYRWHKVYNKNQKSKDVVLLSFLLTLNRCLSIGFFCTRATYSSIFTPSESKKVLDTQPAITCSKLTIETLEQGVKYVQS